MFGFSPKLPITDDERLWADEGFNRLEKLLGRRRMLEAKAVEPTAEDFPDPYDKTAESVEKLFSRVCSYMKVDRKTIDLEIFQDETEGLREILPTWRDGGGTRAAGLYVHAHADEDADHFEGRAVVALRSTLVKDPMTLVATAAHELAHVILLGGKLMHPKTEDHESMTDLLTVFLGLGIFTANASGRFKQYLEQRRIGWSMQRLGYLPRQIFGYALARFATERGENKPAWARHLSPNVRSDFKNSKRWLAENPNYVAMAKPIG